MKRFDENEAECLWKELEQKDEFTAAHCRRVSELVEKFAASNGYEAEEVKWLKVGALLHDVGKVCIENEIFDKLKNGEKLTIEERKCVQRHIDNNEWMARYSDMPVVVDNIVKKHHERYDGSGYPSKIFGDLIPHEVRLVSIADYYDTILVGRNHRTPEGMAPFNRDDAIRIMIENAAVRFDPELLAKFIKFVVLEEKNCRAEKAEKTAP
jgi:putative nucleotidyltransferase with HDIG domain